jgi:hypothetical protein
MYFLVGFIVVGAVVATIITALKSIDHALEELVKIAKRVEEDVRAIRLR